MMYPKKLTALVCVVAVFTAQIPVTVYAAATDYIASQESNTIDDLYAAIDNGDVHGVQNFTTKVRGMLTQAGLGKNYKVNLDFTDNNGDTPLIRAARQGRGDIVNYLVSQGANPNLANKNGETAVVAAANKGHFGIVKALAAKNATVPAEVSTKLAAAAKKNALTADSDDAFPSSTMVTVGIAGGVVIAGAAIVAVAAGGGGGHSGGGGGGGGTPAPTPGLTIDCHPGTYPHPDSCDPAAFLTAESAAQEGIAAMNANYSLARGYDGSIYSRNSNGSLVDELPHGHVKVAVVDTGVDLTHPELDTNILTGLSVTCSDSGCVAGGDDAGADEGGGSRFYHGTAVAGIIAAERNDLGASTGMQGVAPQANIMAIGFADSSGDLTYGDIPGIKYALDNGAQVINASYGYSVPIVNATVGVSTPVAGATPSELHGLLSANYAGSNYMAQFQHVVDNHAIIVFANGNDGFSQPQILAGLPAYFQGATAPVGISQPNYDIVNPTHLDWSHNWVAAVALDSTGKLASYSNQCGISKNYCLAAPGDITTSTTKGGGYVHNIQGTSFAAPNVSGAVAVMLGAYPQLGPEQVLQILFDTATDLNKNPTTGVVDHSLDGVDAVYGRGLVNLQKATSPTDGGWTLSVHSNNQSNNVALNTSAFNLGPAFGNGFGGKGINVMFLDGYGKDYSIPLDVISRQLQKREDNMTKLSRFGYGVFSNRYDISENSHVSYTVGSDNNLLAPSSGFLEQDSSNIKPANAAYITTIGDEKENLNLNFNYKTSVADVFGYAGLADSGSVDLSATGVYKNPYLNFSHDAKSSIVNYNSNGEGFTAGAYQGTQKRDNAYEFDNSDTGIRGMFVQYSRKNDYGLLSLTGGVNMENSTLLGSEATGAFDLAGNTTTYYSSVGGRYDLTNKLSLIGNYNIGMTKAQAGDKSLFTSLSSVVSDSFSLGAEYTGLAKDNDRVGFAVSQPLRVRNSQASLSLPSDVNADGSIVYQNHNISLAPTARELDMETYYGLELSEKSKVALSGVYAINPNNMEQNPNEGVVFLKYSRTFE